jgi:catechol 2,3-dioxygenase-like lactoylglutathione lyase family enzyme
VLKLNHTSFYVSDLEKSKEFFGHLGFKERRRVDVPHLGTVLCFLADAAGSGIIELMHIADRSQPAGCTPPAFGHAHIGLEADDISVEEARLKEAGINFREPVRQVGDGPKIGFIDGPDGITVEVVEYPRGD